MRRGRLGVILATVAALLLGGCGSGGGTPVGGSQGSVPFTTTRTYQVPGANGAAVAVVINPSAAARADAVLAVRLTSLDGLFINTPVTVTSKSSTRLDGTARSTTGVDCTVRIDFSGTQGSQVHLTITGTGIAFAGSGSATEGDHALDITTGGTQGSVGALVGLAAAFGQTVQSFGAGLDPNLDTLPEGTTTIQGCPLVTHVRHGLTVTTRVDYGASGCGSNARVTGAVSLAVGLLTRKGVGTFDHFAVDGHEVTGTFSVTIVGSLAHPSYDITLDLTVAGMGTIKGSATGVTGSPGGAWTIPAATLELTRAGSDATYTVTLTNIVIDPATNHNAMPQAGTLSVHLPLPDILGVKVSVPVVVTFNSQSPVNGKVSVKVGILPAETITIPL